MKEMVSDVSFFSCISTPVTLYGTRPKITLVSLKAEDELFISLDCAARRNRKLTKVNNIPFK
jgi:hypothetical protein